MEIKIIEQRKDYIKFNIIGETHTFGNLLKDEINLNKDTDFATYRKEHPSNDYIEVIVQAQKGKDVNKIISDSLDNIEKNANNFKTLLASEKLDEDEE